MGVAHAAQILFYIAVGIGAFVLLLKLIEEDWFETLTKGCFTACCLLIGAVVFIIGCLLLYSAVVDDDGPNS